jgi:hypothetical protein
VIIGLLLAHSFVDYPMRTEAIMAVFAVSCALLIAPLRPAESAMRSTLLPGRHETSHQPSPDLSPATATTMPTREAAVWHAPQAGGRWGEEIEWPDQWRDYGEPRRPGSTADKPESDGSSETGKDGTDSGSKR